MGFGWYVDNTSELYRALRQSGIEVKGLLGERGGDDEPPTSVLRRSSDTEMVGRSSQQGDENESAPTSTPMFFTVPDDIGLRYQFITPMQMPQDPRMKEGWDWDHGEMTIRSVSTSPRTTRSLRLAQEGAQTHGRCARWKGDSRGSQ